jgi:Pyruvate/2-oxoacid:ferredoxin oxidoreductase delta subunit
MEQVNQMLMELGESPFSVSVGSVVDEEFYSRREFFSLWKKESKSIMKQMTPAKWRFNHHALNLHQHYIDFQFTKITIDTDKCTLCPVCERICDQKCFNFQEGYFSISMRECTSCSLCADICPEKAIILEEKITITEEIKLPIYENKCRVCKHSFQSLHEHDKKCPTCAKLEQ